MFCLNGGAISWKSSKQDIVVDSTTEAEYIATSEETRRLFGSRSSSLDLEWFLVSRTRWTYFVIIMGL